MSLGFNEWMIAGPAPQAPPAKATLRVRHDPKDGKGSVRIDASGRGTRASRVVYLHLLKEDAHERVLLRAIDQALAAVGCTAADL